MGQDNTQRVDLGRHILELLRSGRLKNFQFRTLRHANDYSAYIFPDNEEATEASLKEAVDIFLRDYCPEARLIDPSSPEVNDTPPTERAPERWLSRNFKFQPVMIPFCEQLADQVAIYHKKSRAVNSP